MSAVCAMQTPGASVHWYGKAGISPNRKVGHITIVAPDRATCRHRLAMIDPAAAALLREASPDAADTQPTVGTSAPASGYQSDDERSDGSLARASAAGTSRSNGVGAPHAVHAQQGADPGISRAMEAQTQSSSSLDASAAQPWVAAQTTAPQTSTTGVQSSITCNCAR